jgi:2,4-dienoyl-CoA reductase-like NADH-dependent reductase (Old Yellow Enzyme family)
MTSLFDPIKIGDIELANRIVMAPLTRNRSPGAVPNTLNVTYYEQRATAGLMITEATAITHQGQGYADVPGLYTKEALDGWKRVTDAVHGRRQDRRPDVACRPHLAHHAAAERRQAGVGLGHPGEVEDLSDQ